MKRKGLVTLTVSIFLVLVLAALFVVGCGTSTQTPAPSTSAPAPSTSAPAPSTSAPAPSTSAPAPPKTLKIGHLVALTEWFSSYDIEQDREVKATAEIINENGGITINGQKYNIEIVDEDFKSSLDGTAAAANRLAADGIKFVAGPMGFFSVASSPVLEQYKILHVSSWNTCQPGEMDETTPYGFLGHNSAIGEFAGTLTALKQVYPDIKKFVLICPDDGQIPYDVPIAKGLAQTAGYTIVGDTVGYPNEMTDFSPIGAKLNSIKDADAYIMLSGATPHLGNILKSLRELGNTKPLMHVGPDNCYEVLTIAGKAASTNVMTGGYTPDKSNPPIVQAIWTKLESKYGFNALYLFNAGALYVLVKAIEAAQSLDPAVVKAKWESMDTIDTIYGKGYMGGERTYGIRHAVNHPHSIQRLMDGEVSLAGWVDVSPLP